MQKAAPASVLQFPSIVQSTTCCVLFTWADAAQPRPWENRYKLTAHTRYGTLK